MLIRRRLRGSDGAALVEAALVIPLLMLVLFAVVEFGMLFASTSTTTSATRDGARYATAFYAVQPNKFGVGDDIRQVVEHDLGALTGAATPVRLWIYKADASGQPTSSTCAADCIRYNWNASSNEFDLDAASSPWVALDACMTPASPRIDDIGVMVEVRHRMITGVIGAADRTIKERTSLRLEPLPFTQC